MDNGSDEEWNSLYQWLENNDLKSNENYEYFASKVDVESLLDYMLLEIFISNVDWPANNVRLWSSDGSPWRWIFFDGDGALANWRDYGEMFDYVTCDDPSQTYPSSPHASLLFRRLLANEDFLSHSFDRFSELVQQYFGASHSLPLVDEIERAVADEVSSQFARFGNTTDWSHEIGEIRKYLRSRTDNLVGYYAEYFNLNVDLDFCQLYPNPSTGEATLVCNVNSSGIMTFTIYDILGRVINIFSHDLHVGKNSIALPHLPKGLYFIRTSESHKLLKYVIN